MYANAFCHLLNKRILIDWLIDWSMGSHCMASLAGLSGGSRSICPANVNLLFLTILDRSSIPALFINSSLVLWSRHEMPNIVSKHLRWKTSNRRRLQILWTRLFVKKNDRMLKTSKTYVNWRPFSAHHCHFLLISLRYHPLGVSSLIFLSVRPRFSTILCKFAHNFFPSGVIPLESVTGGGRLRPRSLPIVTPLDGVV